MITPTRLLFLVTMILLLISCQKEKEDAGKYGSGVFIVNEGRFNSNTGSISFYDRSDGTLVNDLFLSVNNRPLGDVVQSFCISGDTGIIVVNNSQKLELVDMNTFLSIGTILGCDYPRYFLPLRGKKGYLSDGNWNGHVYVIDLGTGSIVNQIPVGKGPEAMIRSGDKVYVANSGGWTYDSTVMVIDTRTDLVTDTIIVGDQPTDLVQDARGNIWVLCQGRVVYNQDFSQVISETGSKLVRISLSDHSTKSYSIGQKGDYYQPRRLAVSADGMQLFFDEMNAVYSMGIDDTDIPAAPLLKRVVYGLEADPREDILYIFTARGFDSNGLMYRYRFSGMLVDSMEVGIAPNGAAFR